MRTERTDQGIGEIDATECGQPAATGLGAGHECEGKDARGPARPMAQDGKGAGAFSARARQRVCTTEREPAGREGAPHPRPAPEKGDDQAGKRGRQKMARLVRMHGGLVIKGGR